MSTRSASSRPMPRGPSSNASVPFQFDKDADFNATTQGIRYDGDSDERDHGFFCHRGTTTSTSRRRAGHSRRRRSLPRIAIEENDWDMGQAAYRIDGPGVSMYYQTEAGAFSSMIDQGLRTTGCSGISIRGPGGIYRGTPERDLPGRQVPSRAHRTRRARSCPKVH